MCRMLLYKGRQPIQLAHLLTKPAHSIINQSFDSRLRLDKRRPINGDGFGVGWYESTPDPELGAAPCIFTSVTPAWNNMNLIRLAEKIKSPLVFAHVRASTAGSVSESNCHPWQYGRLMFMHNGNIADFHLIKRKVQESLKDEIFLHVNGNTDSEWAFAVFLNQLETPLQAEPFCHRVLKDAMLRAIELLNGWAKEAGIQEASMMNFAVTDGVSMVCTRYISSKTLEAASLYFSSGTRFESYKPGHYRMIKADKREDVVVIASEPITFEQADWLTIPTNTIVVITSKLNVLLYPILDEFHTPVSTRIPEEANIEAVSEEHHQAHVRESSAANGAPNGVVSMLTTNAIVKESQSLADILIASDPKPIIDVGRDVGITNSHGTNTNSHSRRQSFVDPAPMAVTSPLSTSSSISVSSGSSSNSPTFAPVSLSGRFTSDNALHHASVPATPAPPSATISPLSAAVPPPTGATPSSRPGIGHRHSHSRTVTGASNTSGAVGGEALVATGLVNNNISAGVSGAANGHGVSNGISGSRRYKTRDDDSDSDTSARNLFPTHPIPSVRLKESLLSA